MNSRLCRCFRVRGRWRRCVVVFGYYLLAVILVEQILISTVHRPGLLDDSDVVTVSNTSRLQVALLDLRVLPPTSATVLQSSSTTTSHRPTTSRLSRLVSSRTKPAVQAASLSMQEQEDMFYRRRTYSVNRYLYRIRLEPYRLCPPNTRMVILIHSHHPHTDRRAAIRSTWGKAVRSGSWPNERRNSSCAGLRLVFVFGLHLDPGLNDLIAEERERYDDIIQGDFADSYQNMTLKSLLGLKIVDERCPGVRYLLKTDDDMIVNLPYLLDLLNHTHANLTHSIMGPLNVGSRVYRHGKWKLSKEEFPFSIYPPYESGSAYVITGDLIHELFVTAEYVPYIRIDDVYVTGILGRILGVNHVQQRGFAFWTDKPPAACDLVLNRVVTGTKMTPQNLFSLWSRLQLNLTCPNITSTRTSSGKQLAVKRQNQPPKRIR